METQELKKWTILAQPPRVSNWFDHLETFPWA